MTSERIAPVTVKASISLTDTQDQFARRLVADGRFPSLSAVMQNGLDRIRREVEAEEAEKAALRALLEERRQGRFVTMDEFRRRTDRMIATKRAENGL
jgi:antitoxin ParD1/3/4